ncbi:hypothetical protein [Aeromicrobium chenweiae]|nr:hypothetical protein [Aeromicrobium chenweiae]TGN33249.1 hypothetical protein E4L97_06065 [Aeromicrobium chenweiae]
MNPPDPAADMEKAAAIAADGVKAGAVDAPAKRKWYEKIGAGVAGLLQGAGEAVMDLLTMSPFSLVNMVADTFQLSSGDMTPEELAAKYRLSVESVGDMLDALKDDPLEFGKQLGKGLLDWDTWADDPARALGHLVPDAVAAVFTAGAGTAVTRGVKGTADAADALSDMSRGTRALDDLSDLSKGDGLGDLTKTDELAGLSKTDDLGRADDGGGSSPSPEGLSNKEAADLFDIDNPTQDMRVWRVFGEAQDDLGGLERGSRPFGASWTPKDPSVSPDFRWDAGLPDENPGRFVMEGILRKPGHVDEVRPALPLDGNPGGWPEYLIRDAHEAVEIRSVSGLNGDFTYGPRGWSP